MSKYKSENGEIETKENEIVFYVKKGKRMNVSYDELVDILVKSYSVKDLKPTLLTAEYKSIEMTDVIRQFNFVAEQDYKKGDTINIKGIVQYPYLLAILEQAYNLCKIDGEVYQVDPDKLNEKITTLKSKNEEFINTLNQLNVYGTKNQETTN